MSYLLHDSRLSGNAWKVRILLSQLSMNFRRVTHSLAEGATRKSEFLTKNPVGKVPVLESASGDTLFESNAILCFLAEGTRFFPTQGLERARILQWMFFEQSEAGKPLAAARYWISIAKKRHEKSAEILAWHCAGNRVLRILESHFARHEYLVTSYYTIADLAMFPYVAMANQGEYDMTLYPSVVKWIDRVAGQPGFVPLIEDSSAN